MGITDIRFPQRKCGFIAYEKLAEKSSFQPYSLFLETHRESINEALESNQNTRQRDWTESLAAGSEKFTQEIKKKLTYCTKGRTIIKSDSGTYQLREAIPEYTDNFTCKIEHIVDQNASLWNVNE